MRSLLLTALVLVKAPYARAEAPAAQTFDANGVKICYYVAGKGEAVVLVHGLMSSAQINWMTNGVFDALAKNYQVIALDMPGHGGSDKPDKDEAYGQAMVEDVVLLLDHLKVKKAHVVGYSMGGMVTAKMMATHPDRVLSGTLGGMGWLKEGSALQGFIGKMGGNGKGGLVPPACTRGMAKLALTEDDLKGIKIPVTIIVGDKDPVKKMYVEPLLKVRKDWPVVEIEGGGHINCIMKKEFKDEIVKWIDKQAKK
jgi:pimeloyl-ACP methyl ester carboxylesterase